MGTLEISQLFAALGDTYETVRRHMVPCFNEFYGMAVEISALSLPSSPQILDLGSGTGLLSSLIAQIRPDANFTLTDGSARMLQLAQEHLEQYASSCSIYVQDLRDPIPEGTYDAVVSALAIHHLDDSDKRDLYQRAHRVLKTGGVFVNAEQVAGSTIQLQELYYTMWLERARTAGATEDELLAARERMAFDQPTNMDTQIAWLSEFGFRNVDCFYKNVFFAVFAGWAY